MYPSPHYLWMMTVDDNACGLRSNFLSLSWTPEWEKKENSKIGRLEDTIMTITNTLYLVIIPTWQLAIPAWQFPPREPWRAGDHPHEEGKAGGRKKKSVRTRPRYMPRSPRLPGLPGCYCQVANFWRKGPGCPLCTVYPNSIQAYLRGTYHAFSHRGIHANLHADMHTRYCASLNRLFCSSQGFVCFVLFLFSFPFSKYQQLPGYIYMAGAHFKNSSLPLSVSRAR